MPQFSFDPIKMNLSIFIYRFFPFLAPIDQMKYLSTYDVAQNLQLWYIIGLDKIPDSMFNRAYNCLTKDFFNLTQNFINGNVTSINAFIKMVSSSYSKRSFWPI